MSDKSESFDEWFEGFKTEGEHESMENFDLKLFDLFALKNSCEHTWNHQQKEIDALKAQLSELKEQKKDLKLALEFYADRDSWQKHNQVSYSRIHDCDIDTVTNRLHQCGGWIARMCLEQIKEKEGER